MTTTLEVLRSVEWTAGGGKDCPSCGGYPTHGHSPDCALAAAIVREEAGGVEAIVEWLRSEHWISVLGIHALQPLRWMPKADEKAKGAR